METRHWRLRCQLRARGQGREGWKVPEGLLEIGVDLTWWGDDLM